MGAAPNNNNGGSSSRWRRVFNKFILLPCTSFCSTSLTSPSFTNSAPSLNHSDVVVQEGDDYLANVATKNVCTICLEPLLLNSSSTTESSSPSKAVFTSQCSHSFHLSCISSNIRHGSVSCPICRAQWTRLPHTLSRSQQDPIIRLLDDSISTFRLHRRSFLRTAQYNDDDPVDPNAHPPSHPRRLCFTLTPHYLSVRLAPQPAIDLVLVATPNGPHLRLLKQSMALLVFSLRPVDRLAIVSYSSAAARVFPLRRMTSYGKSTALQVIDRIFYAGHAYADPSEGINKGIKILKDRTHENPYSCILHLSDYPVQTGIIPVSVYQFHVGPTKSIVHEVETLMGELVGGGSVHEVELRIGDEDEDDRRIVRLGELKGDDERRVILDSDECRGQICIGYSYIEGVDEDEHVRVGEVNIMGIGDRRDDVVVVGGGGGADTDAGISISGGRRSCVDSRWEYHDPYMARRWAKRLHGMRRI